MKGRTFLTLGGHSVTKPLREGLTERERSHYTNYAGCISNMNLVYGLALYESTIPSHGSENHSFESWQGLSSMLVTLCWLSHVSHLFTKPKN